jgi:flavin-dependent dehydrogenase
MASDVEVIVVGGGPAGSTVAADLAGRGHEVLLLDKARFPRHKACSDYVNPAGAALLDALGVLGEAMGLGARRMDGMVVHAPDGGSFVAHYARVEPGRAALGISRYRLDHLLLERARAAGVTVRERAHVRDVVRDQGRVAGVAATVDGTEQEIRASLVIAADGRNSAVARALGLGAPLRWPRKTGLAAHYRGVTGLERFGEMHVGHGAYAGLALIEDGLVNVTVVAPDRTVAQRTGSIDSLFDELMTRLPHAAWKLEGAERVGGIRGVGSMGVTAGHITGDGYLLVGDAAAFLDPFAGEGVYEAIRSGLLAAPIASAALRSGDVSTETLRPYRTARRRAFGTKRAVSWIVQGFINTPPAMNYVTARLARREDLGLTLSGVLGNIRPATQALSPVFLARLLRP